MSILSAPYFHDEAKAFAHLESVLWADGVTCPHCGTISDKHYDLGKTRLGLRKCSSKECRKQFTVKVGTVFESAHLPLHKMLQAVYLICSSKKGISSHQLHRILECQYKSAWFLAHRIREALRTGELSPMGGEGQVIEADETYFGKIPPESMPETKARGKAFTEGSKKGTGNKRAILALVERGGSVRTFHIPPASMSTVAGLVREKYQARKPPAYRRKQALRQGRRGIRCS